ncbi:glycosyltransferase [Chitinimonas koreensis]|uniref:glycosyltransferase n=1 Tax=Chitinimonas koreensis TaxID=356302 RepID=UPI00041ECB51|nr:nucleotide disphospho-sugar-binding domain-containing protein [Chitinimonas koreensis]QNM98187.1 glycosyltransferase [Chitinimonas koreensis]
MHILISCVGSAGDVYPFLAIGRALKQRGHRVELLTSAWFQQRVEAAGLGCIPLGTLDDYRSSVDDPDLWHPRRAFATVWKHVEPQLRAGYRALARRAGADTVLVGSTLAWHSRLAEEKLGLPGATVHLSPSCLFSAQEPPVWPGMGWLGRLPPWAAGALQSAVERLVLDPVVRPGINEIRAELGLPPVRRIISRWSNSPGRVICAFPDWFAAPQADWPPHTVTTGFPRWGAAAGAVLDPALTRFLRDGPPPIGITPGSAMAHGRDYFARALAACDALGRRAVLVTPYRDQLPERLPPFAHHVAYVPFDLLAPRLAAFVHHGGIGTLAQGLAAGVPQLVAPFAHDQFDNGVRLARLGAGAWLKPDAKVGDWARTLRDLVADPAVAHACAELAARMGGAEAAPMRIAEMIEALHPAA